VTAVLCIGGLDPSGRAGLMADARAVEAMGARPLLVPTAMTFQTSGRAVGFEPVPPHIVLKQATLLLEDEPVGAIKLGQLASLATAKLVASLVRGLLVVDTPLATSSGVALFPAASAREGYIPLFAKATLVTPNAEELLRFTGGEVAPESLDQALGTSAVLLKGGHVAPDADEVVDLLASGGQIRRFASPRLRGPFRGTGCRLASAIAARLALGDPLDEAVARARDWLASELRREAGV
jgi:hydroxymethylpyrimidine/phosphomethylpyrimidine kinase